MEKQHALHVLKVNSTASLSNIDTHGKSCSSFTPMSAVMKTPSIGKTR